MISLLYFSSAHSTIEQSILVHRFHTNDKKELSITITYLLQLDISRILYFTMVLKYGTTSLLN